ncbi:hypothetical protein HGRIS_003507 [Hohenbuehelia grisea]|uniref:Uncharacterized protein n=1 Tax=Hohenbuehelia grisea TaxID=104357 RepID=A0ABR3JGL0_9AGAR
MSNNTQFDYSNPAALPRPPVARLQFGEHAPSATRDLSQVYTEEGWRELYSMDPMINAEAPPAYQHVEEGLPPYSFKSPKSLNRQFFIYGFLFPLLWLAGTVNLFIVLLSPSPVRCKSWKGPKAQLDDFLLKKIIRDTEVRWGLRCLWGFGLVACIVTTLVVVYQVRG